MPTVVIVLSLVLLLLFLTYLHFLRRFLLLQPLYNSRLLLLMSPSILNFSRCLLPMLNLPCQVSS